MSDLETEMKPVFDALVQRLRALGEPEESVEERATSMIRGWAYFSENTVDQRGHETCRDWMDEEIGRLLDAALRIRYGVPSA
jgi:hypothetical protein